MWQKLRNGTVPIECALHEALYSIGFISEGENAKKFIKKIEQYFTKNKKEDTSNLLAKLIFMKYKGVHNGNV